MLTLIATPIGRTDEITLRSLELLKKADVVICETTKETSKLLKSYEIKAKRYGEAASGGEHHRDKQPDHTMR